MTYEQKQEAIKTLVYGGTEEVEHRMDMELSAMCKEV